MNNLQAKNAACPPDKNRKRIADSGGLYLEVAPNGSKRWFWKYRMPVDGRAIEKRIALGSYPDVSLKAAQEARDEARRLHKAGDDPVMQRRVAKLQRMVPSTDTFEGVAREHHAANAASWSPQYGARWIERMEKDLFPWLGKMRLPEIKAPLLLSVLQRVEGRGANETAHTLRQTAGQVFQRGVQTGRCENNPAAALQGALQPIVVKHMAAVLEPAKAGELMRAIDGYAGQPVTRAALLLSAMLFQRPLNVRTMEWAEVDLDGAMWTIPAMKMKRRLHGKINGRPHLVPLPRQAVEVLRELRPLTGHGRLVFPGLVNGERPMSENTVNQALRRLGFSGDEMTAHGFRAMARTILVENTDVSPDVIEAQLAHEKSGPLGAAYDRAQFMTQRKALMQTWADYLDQLREDA